MNRWASHCGAGLFAAVAFLAACKPVSWEQLAQGFPVNSCQSSDGCAAFGHNPNCDIASQTCTSRPPAFNYTLVVSLPNTSSGFTPTITYQIPEKCSAGRCGYACDAGLCQPLPRASYLSGRYAVELGPFGAPDLGNPELATVIPSSVVLRPLAVSSASLATALGLPLMPLIAQTSLLDPNTDGIEFWGPYHSRPERFVIALPPGDFELTVAPNAPYSATIPPGVQVVHVVEGYGQFVGQNPVVASDPAIGATPPDVPIFNFARDEGVDLTGFTVALRDGTTHRPVSPVKALSPGVDFSHVVLPTNHHADGGAFDHVELAILPPDGSVLPAYVVPQASNQFPSGPSTPQYPHIPAPVMVVGALATPGEIAFTNSPSGLVDAAGIGQANLSYSARVSTSQVAHDGSFAFQVPLPVGTYDVRIAPNDPNYGRSSSVVTVAADAAVSGDFTLVPRLYVSGTALVVDGRPLAGARVVFSPISSETEHFPPRVAEVATNAAGRYTAPLDLGRYNIRVEPAPGSRFPWVVVAGKDITEQFRFGPLPDISVPAPTDSSLTLLDSAGNPVPFAVVRAYAAPDAGAPAIQIGESISDGVGHFSLYLAPFQ